MIYKQDLERLIKQAVQDIKAVAPVRTGNLRASIRYEEIDPLVWVIYVNSGDEPKLKPVKSGGKFRLGGIAPYMPFTNEPWVSPRWNGKKNPNEGWWQKACGIAMDNLKLRLSGQLRKD